MPPGDPAEHASCTSLVDDAFLRSDRVKAMGRALEKVGISARALVRCCHCPDGAAVAGGYIPQEQSVLLCQQWVAQQPREVENTMVHEMIHAYDDARAYITWSDLTQQACTEIRAAHLSGDCNLRREIDRGNIAPGHFAAAGARCVRRRAELSVAMNPSCHSQSEARAAVERAWKTCYADHAPFDSVP